MNFLLVSALSVAALSLMLVHLILMRRKLGGQVEQLQTKLDTVSRELNGISHGSMGVGKKVLAMEKKVMDMHHRFADIKRNDPRQISYAEAGRLVDYGAEVDDLMNSCGISRPEAELVTALSKKRQEANIPILL